MRATWWGRWRWLWLGLGVAGLGIAVVTSDVDLQLFLSVLVSWPAAWMGSDLLSLRFAGNPEPLREWRPAEFLARFVGRLGPFLGVVGAALVAFEFLPVAQRRELTIWLAERSGVIPHELAALVEYALEAALLSALFRRPRRGLITVFVLFASCLRSFLLWQPDDVEWLSLLTTSEGWYYLAIMLVMSPRWSWALRSHLGSWWAAAGVLLAVAIVAGFWIWLIAARRYRRSRAVQRNE